jgi:hypothetical protein
VRRLELVKPSHQRYTPPPGQRQQRTLPPYRQSLVVAAELGFPVRLAHRPDLLDKELAPRSVAQSWRRGPRSCAASAPRRPGLHSGRMPVMPVRSAASSTHRSGWGEPGTVAPNPQSSIALAAPPGRSLPSGQRQSCPNQAPGPKIGVHFRRRPSPPSTQTARRVSSHAKKSRSRTPKRRSLSWIVFGP